MKVKLLSNWGLKIVALLLAFCLWTIVMNIENPLEKKVFYDVPVTLLNDDLLIEADKVYDVLEDSLVVRRVTVTAAKTVLDNITKNDIVAQADIKNLTDIQTVKIEFSVPQYASQVDEITGSADTVKLKIENKASKNLTLEINTIGEVADGYEVSAKRTNQNRINISGAESTVALVSYAAVTVDVTGITSDSYTSETVLLYGEDGNLIDESSFTIKKNIQTVNVTISVLATKSVPIVLDSVIGTPAEGYMTTGVTECAPRTVKIAGAASVLNEIKNIAVPQEDLDITGLTDDLVKVLDIRDYLASGVQLADDDFNGEVTATVYIEPINTRLLQIPAGNITITNVPDGYLSEILDENSYFELEVQGLEAKLSALQSNLIRGTIDMNAWMEELGITELTSGTYSITAEFVLDEAIKITRPVTVRISFTKEDGSDAG